MVTDGRIILVRDDVLDSGNQRHQASVSTYTRQKLLGVYISPWRKRRLQDALSDAERSFFKSGTMAVMVCATDVVLMHWALQQRFSGVWKTVRAGSC